MPRYESARNAARELDARSRRAAGCNCTDSAVSASRAGGTGVRPYHREEITRPTIVQRCSDETRRVDGFIAARMEERGKGKAEKWIVGGGERESARSLK